MTKPMTPDLARSLLDDDSISRQVLKMAVLQAADEVERLDADAACVQAELASVKACWREELANVTTLNQEIERLKTEHESMRLRLARYVASYGPEPAVEPSDEGLAARAFLEMPEG